MDEALADLARLGYDAKVLAGGQSLIPAMNFRLAQPAALVDLNRIDELFYIRPADGGGLAIGAMTRDSDVEHDPLVAERAPLLHAVMPHVAHPQIRSRGTFGGSIAHADPAAEIPAVTVALGARYLVRSSARERWIAAEDFYAGPFATQLEPDELLIEIALPPLPPRSGWSFHEMARQHGAFALAGAVAVVTLDEQGRCGRARLVFLNCGDKPQMAQHAAALLAGQPPTLDAIRAVAEAAASDVDPSGDIHATADYRRHLALVLARRALADAFERALRGGG